MLIAYRPFIRNEISQLRFGTGIAFLPASIASLKHREDAIVYWASRFKTIRFQILTSRNRRTIMLNQLAIIAAADYSIVYMLGGGGIVGAVVIYFLARMFGK